MPRDPFRPSTARTIWELAVGITFFILALASCAT